MNKRRRHIAKRRRRQTRLLREWLDLYTTETGVSQGWPEPEYPGPPWLGCCY